MEKLNLSKLLNRLMYICASKNYDQYLFMSINVTPVILSALELEVHFGEQIISIKPH